MKTTKAKNIISEATPQVDTNFITQMGNLGFSFMGNNITDCGEIRIGKYTMYEIHKTNKMAFAYRNKISQMIARDGFYVVDQDGNELDSKIVQQDLDLLYKFLGGKYNLDLVVGDYFDQLFCSGQVIALPSKINGLGLSTNDGTLKILDTRGIQIQVDAFGTPEKYQYQTVQGVETFSPNRLVDFIGYRDIDIKYQGISVYNSVAMDAITNQEANRTQMYFFKNNAQPNLFIMLNPEAFKGTDGPAKKAEFDRQWKEKYGGTVNSGKTHSSHLITDIKTLDISNVDLDLLNLRRENDQSFSVVFMLDSRLIGLWKSTGSYGEVESTTIRQGNEQVDSYGRMFSDFINQLYKKFVNPAFVNEFRCWNSEFKDVNKDKDVGLKEVAGGVITPNEYRTKFGYEIIKDPAMDKVQQKQAPAFGGTPA